MTQTLLALALFMGYAVVIGIGLWVLRKLRHQTQQQFQRALEQNLRFEQRMKKLEARLEMYRASCVRSETELQESRRQLKEFKDLSLRVLQLEQRDPYGVTLRQATELASMGATPEELSRQCGLTQAEAELLSRIQQQGR